MCGIKHLCINLKERNGKKKTNAVNIGPSNLETYIAARRQYIFFDRCMYHTHEKILNTFVPSLKQFVSDLLAIQACNLLTAYRRATAGRSVEKHWSRSNRSPMTSSATSARQSSQDNLLQRLILSLSNFFRARWPSLSQHMDQNSSTWLDSEAHRAPCFEPELTLPRCNDSGRPSEMKNRDDMTYLPSLLGISNGGRAQVDQAPPGGRRWPQRRDTHFRQRERAVSGHRTSGFIPPPIWSSGCWKTWGLDSPIKPWLQPNRSDVNQISGPCHCAMLAWSWP